MGIAGSSARLGDSALKEEVSDDGGDSEEEEGKQERDPASPAPRSAPSTSFAQAMEREECVECRRVMYSCWMVHARECGYVCMMVVSSKTNDEFETADDIDFMADLERVEAERQALAAENERLFKQQVPSSYALIPCPWISRVHLHECADMRSIATSGSWAAQSHVSVLAR